ncbi:hypothetical protein RJ640_011442, partial [Escallonia rubra]
RCKTAVVQDRISNLPGEILSHILSSLCLKEAAATSILSRSWNYLWKSVDNLDFCCSRRHLGIMCDARCIQMVGQVLRSHEAFKRCKTAVVQDRISNLPGEILSHILSSLCLKEAAATSILSRSWRYLWKSVDNLDFCCSRRHLGIMCDARCIQMVGQVLRSHEAFKRCKTAVVQDRISNLPGEILSHILSSLCLKEAAATSILSRSWRYLWKSVDNLDFCCSRRHLGIMCDARCIQMVGQVLRSHEAFKRCKTAVVQDRISNLPGEILSHILSSLCLKEAAATSILSRSWRYLWKSVDNLDFCCSRRHLGIMCDARCIQMVGQVLRSHEAFKVKKFRLLYTLDRRNANEINRWISFAIASGVHTLDLSLSVTDRPFFQFHQSRFRMPYDFFDKSKGMEPYLKHLGATSSTLSPLSGTGNLFNSLRDLSFNFMALTDQIVQNILSGCVALERLHLGNSPTLINIKHAAPLPRLKFLVINQCSDLKSLDIVAPNLVSFKYQGEKISFCLKDAEHLVDMNLQFPNSRWRKVPKHAIDQLFGYLSQLESLTLHLGCIGAGSSKKIPEFPKLKHLVLLERSFVREPEIFLRVLSLIKASPFLHRLELHLRAKEFLKASYRIPISPMEHLEEVMLSGFQGIPDEMEFAFHILDNAIVLKKLEIVTCCASSTFGRWKFAAGPGIGMVLSSKGMKQLLEKPQLLLTSTPTTINPAPITLPTTTRHSHRHLTYCRQRYPSFSRVAITDDPWHSRHVASK